MVVEMEDREITIPFDETVAELKHVLPATHPAFKKVEDCLELAGRAIESALDGRYELENQVERYEVHSLLLTELVLILDDWRRGIRRWEEVEDRLRAARDRVESFA